ncbi:RNA polymerase sigma factor [Marinilongibacter aquaticus]|uniref:RNA polymerase sigma factor n=1 Tax=Marinilongibacter aquaticus TaxID=2975157 RepID=UPI0021BD0D6B|nr:RNA polymerase sigma factor [Marinilongibacter aquaticus]UBM60166.1 RNA polymerase sigma factor [Marinilongibacter aquaticus]
MDSKNAEYDLIAAIARGNKEAFRQIYSLYNEKVFNTVISYTQNEADAEEVTQDVFLRIHKYAENFKGESAPSTWIYRIAVNASLNFIKKKKRFSFFQLGKEAETKTDFVHPGAQLEKREEVQILFKYINTLPENQKTAFILSFVEELPRQEVADIMKLSLKAAESLLQRAKANLRIKLEKVYPERRKS